MADLSGGRHYTLARQSISLIKVLQVFVKLKDYDFSVHGGKKHIQNLCNSHKWREIELHQCKLTYQYVHIGNWAYSWRTHFVQEINVPRNIALFSPHSQYTQPFSPSPSLPISFFFFSWNKCIISGHCEPNHWTDQN